MLGFASHQPGWSSQSRRLPAGLVKSLNNLGVQLDAGVRREEAEAAWVEAVGLNAVIDKTATAAGRRRHVWQSRASAGPARASTAAGRAQRAGSARRTSEYDNQLSHDPRRRRRRLDSHRGEFGNTTNDVAVLSRLMLDVAVSPDA